MKIKRKKGLLTRHITMIISLLIIGTVGICLVLNTTLLEKYYTLEKEQKIIEAYMTIDEVGETEEDLESEDFDIDFENLCANGNLKIIVLSSDGTVVRSSGNDFEAMKTDLQDTLFAPDKSEIKVLEDTDEYQLLQRYDPRLDAEYLTLIGSLDNGDMVLIRTAMESIHESAIISNSFMMLTGFIMIGIGILAGIFVSRRITKPVVQLTEISKRMDELDFNAKYEKKNHGRPNEIDELGDHINHLSETLEQTISELKTANAELQQDIEKKIEIDEMRKEFLSNVSHELKTPLALIQGYAEGLQECINDDAESRDFYCDVIIDEANKMNKMVKKLLTLNQLEFGNEQVTMERFNMTELVHGVAVSTQILMEQDGITLDMAGLEDVDVWGDEFKVEEVMTNYISNAIHHCEGEKRIRISYSRPSEDILRISVFNTGKPIPEEDIDNIWIKFYKVDKARTRAYGGSGIGLSIVKAIMDSFGRECGVINHEDGVEFWLELSTK